MQERRRTRRRQRIYRYSPARERKKRLVTAAGIALCTFAMIFSAVQIGSYMIDFFAARQASQALRQAYYQEEPPEETAAQAQLPTGEPTRQPTPTPAPSPDAAAAVAEAMPATHLEEKPYPNNELTLTSTRFKKIQRQNSDIVGWLTITGLLDEAVVQRDNEYYLRRDYRGYHNVNGAIFMDENIRLKTRPYTLMLYGHNMKTGAMFGGLRNYENVAYYKNAPFITFDTMYEDGRYVIFAASTVGIMRSDWNFVDFGKLNSTTIAWRNEQIRKLKALSEFSSAIDVTAEDQLLLLVTCVDDDTERRVVAARRIRDDETEEQLAKVVQRSQKQ